MMPVKLLVCTDIYGHTEALEQWVKDVLPTGWQHKIVSPYRLGMDYQVESLAYIAFQSQGGLDGYANRIRSSIINQKPATVVVGFSAGAAAMYKVLAEDIQHSVVSFTGFYPGQIRFFTDLVPSVPTRLIFPSKELNFDLAPVIQKLEQHANVTCESTSYQHGFMNPHSRGFCDSALADFSQQIAEQMTTFNG